MTDDPICELCGEPITAGTEATRVTGVMKAHRVCLLRSATGGIGHLLEHGYWCLQVHDPDGGLTLYESAVAVDHWIHRHGVEAAFADHTDGIPHP